MCDAAGAVRYLTLPISGELAGSEVNTLLRRHLGLSGTVLRRVKWLSDGITVDGARVNVRFRVAAGQVLSVRLSDPDSASQPLPRPGPLDLVYEDEDLVVVNKAPGVLVHPSHGHFDDTVGNFLMARYRENREGAGFHPVHRLDKGTSGLLVVAKHPYGQEKLKSQLHTGAFRLDLPGGVRRDALPRPGSHRRPHRACPRLSLGSAGGPGGAVRPHPLPGGMYLRSPLAGGAAAGHRTHPPDPGPHGPHGLSPHWGLSLRSGGSGAHHPACPPLRPA